MNSFHYKTREANGFTLVELMVAVTIGLFLLAGVIRIFMGQKATYQITTGLARVQENGRFALDMLTRDLRMADYWGCLNGLTKIINNLNPAGVGYDADLHGFPLGLEGVDGGVGGNDSVTMRGVLDDLGLTVQAPYGPQASSNIFVNNNNEIFQGEVLLISDCLQGDIFQVSNANPGSTGTLVHNTGNVTQPSNYNPSNPGCPGANAHCLSKVYEGDAQVYGVVVITYFVAPGESGEPALFRSRNGVVDELVEGVESLQFLYGEDTDGDGVANRWLIASGVNMNNVTAMRIAMLMRTPEEVDIQKNSRTYQVADQLVDPVDDRRARRIFSTTVELRNRGLK
ncbi:MAG: PilW family protein [Magnetococcus sp. DMHC-6]